MSLSPAERGRLIDAYAAGPARLRAAFGAVPEPVRQWRPSPTDWSAHEVVCHCADSESNASLRIRYLVVERDPLIVGYDQEAWARVLDYHALSAATALVTVDAVRANTVPLLRTLPEDAWRKEGRHTESGRYTAEDWLRIYAEHLELHARQIEGNLAAWQARLAHPSA
jgi:DinB superfamily